MKSLKKAFRLICLSLLILLASIGVGISGGIAIPLSRKKEDGPIQTELLETDKENQEKLIFPYYKGD